MLGVSSSSKEKIEKVVESMFDSIALDLLGNIPKLKNKKTLTFTIRPSQSLGHLFVQSMGNVSPNEIEKDVLKSILNSAYGFIDSLKSSTVSHIVEGMDGLAREAKLKKTKITPEQIQELLDNEMNKAKNKIKVIAEAEATKFRNLGTSMQITRVASDLNDEDPTVFFTVTKDASTCKECIRLHLMPDGVTPRLWKFSELKQGYGKRGDNTPSAWCAHPNCRCSITYLSSGFSFNKQGLLEFRSLDFDAYKDQKNKSK